VLPLLPRTRAARRWALGLVVTLAVLGAGGAALAATRGSGSGATDVLATASSGTMRQTVSASGTLSPKHEADLNFAVDGEVTAVPAKVGDKVAKGDVLARVDRSALRIDVTAAEATVTAAESQLAQDQTSGASATQLSSDEASLSAAQSSLSAANASLADATLRSTIAGTVASVDLAVGDQVSGSASSGGTGGTGGTGTSGSTGTGTSTGTTAQVVVISTKEFVVDASVGASDLASVKKGLQAEITPAGATDPIFGTVTSVGLVAESSTTGSSTFPVVIDVTGKVSGVYAGSSADVSIIVKQLQNVLTVPTAAVHNINGATSVTLVKNGKQQKAPVTIGAVYGAQTQITQGLSAGDQVLVTTVQVPSTGGTGNRPPGGGFGGGGFGGGGFGGGGPAGGPPGGAGPGNTVNGTGGKTG
jgi:multidrug efflux pump subunit AcrA (membrane-fusion protein)